MIEQAINKINKEIEKEKNEYVKVTGEYLLQVIEEKGNEAATKINEPNKTIMGSLKVMSDEAKKNAKDGVAVLTREQGFKVVNRYFGIEADSSNVEINTSKETKSDSKLNMSLDDFM